MMRPESSCSRSSTPSRRKPSWLRMVNLSSGPTTIANSLACCMLPHQNLSTHQATRPRHSAQPAISESIHEKCSRSLSPNCFIQTIALPWPVLCLRIARPNEPVGTELATSQRQFPLLRRHIMAQQPKDNGLTRQQLINLL